MKKFFMAVIIFLLVAFALVVILKDTIVKVGVEKGVKIVTGLRLQLSSVNLELLNTLIDIKGLLLYNPIDFEDKIMVDIPHIYVKYNLSQLLKRKVHLYEARFNLKEFVVVKNKDGKVNLDALKVVQVQKEGKGSQEKAKTPQIQIDKLQLKIGKVIYKDYSKGPTPVVKEFNINLDETYSDIKDPNALATLILVKAMMNTTISGLVNFDLRGLSTTLGDTLSKTESLISDTTEKIKDKIKLPFGGK
ncbi:MAG: hypothetical protein NC818_06235 [Candidatus Omnitrophica bacterium]|nr:hypothetical protein [Candidatus Omnitrophota bacterium]MCM8784349.1 hypothetical protein [Candidatus Omnitrophota bacterium]